MYEIALYLHSWNRWLVLLAGVWVIVRSFGGWHSGNPYQKTDNTAAAIFLGALHLQLLLGLLLQFWLSPVTDAVYRDMGAAMKDSAQRFWAVEHMIGMIIAIIIAQVARILSKKAKVPSAKHRIMFWGALVSLVIIFLNIPWGFIHQYRPMFRM
jgi:hypothetical protein